MTKERTKTIEGVLSEITELFQQDAKEHTEEKSAENNSYEHLHHQKVLNLRLNISIGMLDCLLMLKHTDIPKHNGHIQPDEIIKFLKEDGRFKDDEIPIIQECIGEPSIYYSYS